MIISGKKVRSGTLLTALALLLTVLGFLVYPLFVSSDNEGSGEPDELLFYTWTGDHYFRAAAVEFESLYRIPVRVVVCDSDVYIRKARGEVLSAEGTIDGLIVNSTYQMQQLTAGGENPVDFVPLFSTVSGFLYDPQVLSDPPSTREDFQNWINRHPGDFGFTAVRGEGGFSFIHSLLMSQDESSSPAMPNDSLWEPALNWIRSERESIVLTSSDYDSLRLFSSGKLKLTTIAEHQVLDALKKGQIPETVRMYVPRFGSVYNYYGMAIPDNAPHRESARLFSRYLKTASARASMAETLSVRPVGGDSPETEAPRPAMPELWDHYDTLEPSPGETIYSRIIETFKDKVLYF